MNRPIILNGIKWNLDDSNFDHAFLSCDRLLSREQRMINIERKLNEPLILIPNQRTRLVNIKIWIGKYDPIYKAPIGGKHMLLHYQPDQIKTIGDLFGSIVTFFNSINPETGRRYIDDTIKKDFLYFQYKGGGGHYEFRFTTD